MHYKLILIMLNQIPEEQIIKRLKDDNAWWSYGSIEDEFKAMPPRAYFDLFYPLVVENTIKRAVVLMGPRRVGKTVMLRHTIQALIDSGVSAKKICYITLDAPIYNKISLERLFELCQIALNDFSKDGFTIIFDEVQYLKDWEVHLKALVDRFRQSKFVVSGSAAAALKLKSNESGAGRFTDFSLPPLTFYEYIQMVLPNSNLVYPIEYQWGPDKITLFNTTDIKELNRHFISYINIGGYPEIVYSSLMQSNTQRYVKNDIVDKVLLRDLPSLYGINDVQELNSLFNTVAYHTAKEFSLESLNNTSHVDKLTIKKYLEYLEAAYLIKTVRRIDMSGKQFKRANFFKLYLTNTSIRRALFDAVSETDANMGEMVENAIVSQWFHRPNSPFFYARWQKEKSKGADGEVDIVGLNALLNPAFAVEIKWSDRFITQPYELKSLLSFLEANKLSKAVVTSISTMGIEQVQGKELHFIPSAIYAYTVGHNTIKMLNENGVW